MESEQNTSTPPWMATIISRLDDIQADRQQEHAERATIRAQIDELRALIASNASPSPATATPVTTATPASNVASEAQVETDTRAATASVPADPQQSSRKPLPMGMPYSGDKAGFLAWKVTMDHKLEADREFIGTARDQYAFIWANLSSSVQREVAAWYETGGDTREFRPEHLMGYLEFCYADNHSREKAQANLENLKQAKNETFPDFFVRFQRLLMQSGGAGWDGEQKLNKLRRSLNSTIRTIALNRGVSRTDYAAAIASYRSIAVDLEAQNIEISGRPVQQQQAVKRDSDGDVVMTHVGAVNTARQKKGGQRANRVPDEVYKHRKEKGLCVRCGSATHYVRDCENAVNHNLVSVASAASHAQEANTGED